MKPRFKSVVGLVGAFAVLSATMFVRVVVGNMLKGRDNAVGLVAGLIAAVITMVVVVIAYFLIDDEH